ncbi:hypothetical protein D8674_027587 [Pyrus ussuriensis x Pyrus communis]|uniref:Uncharacterized protein n=1 Tax=Pyrus ussuriensis x Pyrus communis TaxID=2448454 RepID=A0A5N5ID51_9ROSA|nr:hypothetical protein D8674_027587 [Pyrus ussuriensis x Pyrus communis]
MAKTSKSICLSVLFVMFIVFAVADSGLVGCRDWSYSSTWQVQTATRHAQKKVRLLEPAYFSSAFAMMVKVVRRAASLHTSYTYMH